MAKLLGLGLMISLLTCHSIALRLLSQEKSEVWASNCTANSIQNTPNKDGDHKISECQGQAEAGKKSVHSNSNEEEWKERNEESEYEDSDYIYTRPKP